MNARFAFDRTAGWVLGRSANSIRDEIRSGFIKSARTPAASAWPVRRPKQKRGRQLADRDLERLIDAVIATNQAAGSAS